MRTADHRCTKSDPSLLTRRRFTALSAGGLASLALAPEPARAHAPLRPLAPASGQASLVLAGVPRASAAEERQRAVRRAALLASDFCWLGRGDRVLIKPVCNSGSRYPFTTDPLALRAMIRLLIERGAGKVIVADMSGVQAVRFGKDRLRGSTRELMRNNGMAQAAEAAGAEVQAFEEAGWDAFHEEEPAHGKSWPGAVMMPDLVREVDHIVLMPRCGRHLLAGSSLGMKAAVGWWRHDSRLDYHRRGSLLPEKTAEGNGVPSLLEKQRLVLTSASQVSTTFGPDNGYVVTPETGLVIASTSLLAHDMISLAFLLENLRLTPTKHKNGPLDDPHRWPFMLRWVNRAVISMLAGVGQMFSGDAPPSVEHESIWDDRVLRRAFEIAGGVPKIEFGDASGDLPAALLRTLTSAVERPAA